MKRETYRKILIAMFAVYLCAFSYYLSCIIYAFEKNDSNIFPVISLEKMQPVMSTKNEEKDQQLLMPLGMPVGIYIHAKGIMVLDTGIVTDIYGEKEVPAEKLLKRGDYILAFNGMEVNSIDGFSRMIQENEEKSCTLTVLRNQKEMDIQVTPVQTGNDNYKLGVWVRQDAQGIGTLTYMDANGNFGALGHGITDVDTNEVIDIQDGRLYNSEVLAVVKGKDGTPGELVGYIDYKNDSVIGEIQSNNAKGIYGELDTNSIFYDPKMALPAASSDEVKVGEAQIRCSVDGEVVDYQIEIESVKKKSRVDQKDMVIRIVDERLLEKNGGIVQGMSGSPIIQDGKLVGAVTHVLVNDPTRGYGIFIENMLDAAG